MKPFAAFLGALLLCATCGYSQDVSSLAPDEFSRQIAQSNIQILDVRTAGEYQTGHISKSFQANWNDQAEFQERIKYLDKDKPVYVYCLSGGRSTAAADWLHKNGFSQVSQLRGGINAWKMASLPVEGSVKAEQISLDQYKSKLSPSSMTLVDFGAVWCPPCKKMQPVIDQLQKDMPGSFLLVPIDAGVQTELMKSLKVDGIPTFIIYKQGVEVWRRQGITDIDEFKKALSHS